MKKVLSILVFVVFALCLLTACNDVELSLTFDASGGIFENGDENVIIKTDGSSEISVPENPTKDGYIFKGWFRDNGTFNKQFTADSLLNESIQSDMIVYAKWEINTYTVTFKNYEGSILKNETVDYGNSAIAPESPEREATAQYTYTFSGWDIAFNNVTEDITVIATYSEAINTFSVTFKDWWGTILKTETVAYGNSAIAPESPAREATTQYTYTFSGWDIGFNIVTEDLTVTPNYSETINTFSVTFKDWEGTILKTETVDYGNSATAPINPEREASAQYTYTFNGWDKAFNNVTEDITVTSWYSEILNTYTVTFKDWEGTILKNETVDYGNSATAPINPEREASAQYTYTFNGWDILFNNVTEDITVTAQYTNTINTYILNFESNGGTEVASITKDYGTVIDSPLDTEREGYTFGGWYTDNEVFQNRYSFPVELSQSYTLYAKWIVNNYTITFESNGGNEISPVIQDFNTVVLEPVSPTRTGYIFCGWASNADLAEEYEFEKMPAKDNILYAIWSTEGLFFRAIYGGYSVRKGTMSSSKVIIPSIYNGKPVLEIDEYAFIGCSALTEITISTNITLIRKGAFHNCVNLTKITFPSTLINIEDYAFSNCTSMTAFEFSSGVKTIGEYAFTNCSSLINITLPTSIEYLGANAFNHCQNLNEILIDSLNNYFTTDNGILYDKDMKKLYKYPEAKAETQFDVPSSVMYIDCGAFSYNENVININFTEDSLKEIGDYAFYYCTKLENISIPSSVVTMGHWSFAECPCLVSINIPAGVTSLGSWIFYACTNLQNIDVAEGSLLSNIGSYAFNCCSGLKNITLPESVTSIEHGAFNACININYEIYDNDLKYLGNWLIRVDNKNITSANLKNTTLGIMNYAFRNCTMLESIIIPSTVSNIGSYAFNNCTGLTNVTLSDGIINIGDRAFLNCSSISSLYIPESVLFIGIEVLGGCTSISEIVVDENNPNYKSINGVLFNKDGTELLLYPKGSNNVSYTVPEGVIRISEYAFSNCDFIENIVFSSTVTTLESFSFYGCDNLTNVTIPSNVANLYSYCFSNSGLVEIILEREHIEDITSCGYGIFEDCPSELKIYVPASSVDNYQAEIYWNTYSEKIYSITDR